MQHKLGRGTGSFYYYVCSRIFGQRKKNDHRVTNEANVINAKAHYKQNGLINI